MKSKIQMPQNELRIDREFVPQFTIHTQRKDVRNRCKEQVDTQPKEDHNTYTDEIGATFPLTGKLVAGSVEFNS